MSRLAEFARSAGLKVVVLLLILNVCLLGWYIFIGYQLEFHSDSTVKVLLAREIVELGDYFPDDWNYVNGDLFVLFGHTFIVPLLAFMPAGYAAHAISGLISAMLILLGIWFLTSITGASVGRRVLIVAIVAAGISGFMAENLYGQAAYGAIVYQSCFVVVFSFLFLNATRSARRGVLGTVTFILIVLIGWSNPQRALVVMGMPLFAAISWYRFTVVRVKSRIETESVRYLYAILLVGIVVGTILHHWSLGGVENVLGIGPIRWLAYEDMLRNLGLVLKGYLAIFGGLPPTHGEVVSMAGVYEALRLGVAILLLGLMFYQVFGVFCGGQAGMAFLGIFSGTAFLIVMFLQVTTTIPDMTEPIQSSRYLLPSLLFLLVFTLARPLDTNTEPLAAVGIVVLGAVFVTSAYPSFVKSDISSKLDWGPSSDGKFGRVVQGLRRVLADSGLRYGYASYWNAGVLTVMSDEETRVRPIVLERGLPVPMRYLSSNRWYRPSSWHGETFLLLTQQEAESIDRELLELYAGEPTREFVYDGFKIIVFDRNLASVLPGWEFRYETPESFLVTEGSLTTVGRLVENYDERGPALIADKGDVGWLHFGPYISMDPGEYRISFMVSADFNENGSLRLEVAAGPDQESLAEKTLLSSSGTQDLIFELHQRRTLEFRVWSLGTEKVIFRGFTIERLSGDVNGVQ